MTIPVINPNTAKFSWTDATTNADGSPIQSGEITGYVVGVRSAEGTTQPDPLTGSYPLNSPTVAASAVSEAVAAMSPMLQPDTYFAAVRSVGPMNSAWSAETEFTIAQPQPNPPTSFGVA